MGRRLLDAGHCMVVQVCSLDCNYATDYSKFP